MKIVKRDKLSLTIRRALWEDYQFCHKLAKQNMSHYIKKYWGGWSPRLYRKGFNPKNTWIVLYNKKRIAFFRTKTKKGSLYFEDMQVSKLMRGKGIGTYLMKLIERKAIKNKIRRIRLTVFKDNPAKRLYDRLGYKVIKDKTTSVLMEKRLG